TSNKFWEIVIEGASHTVRFGRIGTSGQAKTKSFGSSAAAADDADQLVREKVKKGYGEVTASVGAPPKPVAARIPAKTQPAVRTTLNAPRGKRPIVLTFAGARLEIDGVPEELASPAEAKRRLDAIVRERLKEGYTLGAVDIDADEAPEEEEYVHVDDEPEAEEPTVEVDQHRRFLV